MSSFLDVKKQSLIKTNLEKCYQCSVSIETSLDLKVWFSKNSSWSNHPLSQFKTVKVLFFSLIVFSLFISSASRIFLLCMYGEMRAVFGCTQSKCLWHSFVCSVAPDGSDFPLILPCWCSMYHARTLFFESPIYFLLHQQSNWYTPGWLFGSSFGKTF